MGYINSFMSGQFVKLISFSFKMSGVYIFSCQIRPRYEWFQTWWPGFKGSVNKELEGLLTEREVCMEKYLLEVLAQTE